ncbi:MAG: PqqD family protein [Armatimonadetes bacterium]|nr:PqqD family protein [Armatimonadota bacterium]
MDKPVRRKDLLGRQVADEWMIYDASGKAVHVLNETARFVWDRCDGEHDVEDIVAEAVALYEVSEAEAREDILACLASFAELSILEQ